MRIIAGKYKSRKINEPVKSKGNQVSTIRPTSDRARETIFDILASRLDFTDTKCIDLFAGTGAYGFESLSRGALHSSFVDISGKSLELIRKTAEDLDVKRDISIIKSDSIKFLRDNEEEFDLIFADPPYKYDNYDLLVELVFQNKFLFFILETSTDKKFEYDKNRLGFISRNVGKTFFLIYYLLP